MLSLVAFLVGAGASVIAAMTVVGTQGLKGTESIPALTLMFAGLWALLFGVAGGIARFVRTADRAQAARALVSYGIGGLVSGATIVILLVIGGLGGSPMRALMAFAIPLFMPWIVGRLFLMMRGKTAG